MTTWLIGHYHGWHMAIAGAPVTDLSIRRTLSDGGWDEFIGGGPWAGDVSEAYREQSPITSAATCGRRR